MATIKRKHETASNGPSSEADVEKKIKLQAGTPERIEESEYILHKYDMCPFCVRVELFLGWKEIPYSSKIYGYGDKEGPTQLIGKKMLPVLTYTPRKGEPHYDESVEKQPSKHLGESLDIIKFVDERDGKDKVFLKPATDREDLKKWVEKLSPDSRPLLMPRTRKLPLLDLAKQEDLDYHAAKYQDNVEELLAKTDEYISRVNERLKELESLIKGDNTLNKDGLGYDDIIYLPPLRNLTVVKNISWPPKVLEYVTVNTKKAKVELYTPFAI